MIGTKVSTQWIPRLHLIQSTVPVSSAAYLRFNTAWGVSLAGGLTHDYFGGPYRAADLVGPDTGNSGRVIAHTHEDPTPWRQLVAKDPNGTRSSLIAYWPYYYRVRLAGLGQRITAKTTVQVKIQQQMRNAARLMTVQEPNNT